LSLFSRSPYLQEIASVSFNNSFTALPSVAYIHVGFRY